MQARNQTLVALALTAALASPLAFAQQAKGTANANATVGVAGATQMDDSTKAFASSSNAGKGNWWADADTDGDGKLSTTEATANAGLNSRFGTIDGDKDGFVTQDEYRTFFTSNANQGAENAAMHSTVVTRDLWTTLDVDTDSKLSLAEVAANAELTSSFASIDANADGFVTQDEYTVYAKANMSKK